MTQQNEEHFEVIDRNKDRVLQRKKNKFIENRLSNVEKAIESHAKILEKAMSKSHAKILASEYIEMTEGDNS
jgi:argonaute-like protein implicated in RNA metabolism and viral defense